MLARIMESAFNEKALRQRVERLSPQARLAFLLSCGERLAPNYTAFRDRHGWGDFAPLQQALDLGWKALAREPLERSEIEACHARCEEAIPHPDDFTSDYYVSGALDAGVVCSLVTQLLLEDDPGKVVEGAAQARDTVDMHVQELEDMNPRDPDLEGKILRHPVMQRELRRQREDLTRLEGAELSPSLVEALAREWRHPAMSNIDRPAAPR